MTTTWIPILLTLFATALSTPQPSILIVGAGASGVAAATRLLSEGFTNVTVLEAEPRIGGRIHSVFFGDAYVDLEAHWCHGEGGNMVYQLVKDLGVLRHSGEEGRVFHSRRDVSEGLSKRIMGVIEAVTYGKADVEDESAEEYYNRRYIELATDTFTDAIELEVALSARQLLVQYILVREGSLTLEECILESDYQSCEGDLYLNWNGNGYKTILDVLIGRFSNSSQKLTFDEKLLLNKEVSNINWEEDILKVVCADGSAYSADHVIFTPSIGVLKHDHPKIFTPHLPKAKRRAIEDLGYGTEVDVSLYFPDRWWPSEEEFSGYYFVWNEEDAREALEEYCSVVQNATSAEWILDFFNVRPTEQNPNVLTMWMTGSTSREIETLSDAELIQGILFVLEKFLGSHYKITLPTRIIRSEWYSNTHFRGVYSAQTQKAYDSKPSAEAQLSLPLTNSQGRPFLQFAGEATSPNHFSTVHGAIETGFREADRIIALHKSI